MCCYNVYRWLQSLCHNHLCFWGQLFVHSIFHRRFPPRLLRSLLVPSSFLSHTWELNIFSIIDALSTGYIALTLSIRPPCNWNELGSRETVTASYTCHSSRSFLWVVGRSELGDVFNSLETGRRVCVYRVIGALRPGGANPISSRDIIIKTRKNNHSNAQHYKVHHKCMSIYYKNTTF